LLMFRYVNKYLSTKNAQVKNILHLDSNKDLFKYLIPQQLGWMPIEQAPCCFDCFKPQHLLKMVLMKKTIRNLTQWFISSFYYVVVSKRIRFWKLMNYSMIKTILMKSNINALYSIVHS
jgi:hypothetical protein